MQTANSPYRLAEPPTSTGRALLARAFVHWCTLHYGNTSEEIADALEEDHTSERAVVQHIRFAARLIGELIAAGRLRSSARPFGGGSPMPIPPEHWEIDDFRARFARSAYDPSQPFVQDAEPTHWIFFDLEDFNLLVEESCAEVRPFQRAAKVIRQDVTARENTTASSPADDHVRLPEVMRRTGMSRSTIYRRIEQGRFPVQIPMDGNIAAWREGDVADWLANPR